MAPRHDASDLVRRGRSLALPACSVVCMWWALAAACCAAAAGARWLGAGSWAPEWDVVVYAATPAGTAAALSAADTDPGARVLLLEPTVHVGGMATAGGIGFRDFLTAKRITSTLLELALLNGAAYGHTSPVWQPDGYVGERSFNTLIARRPNVRLELSSRLRDGAGSVVVVGAPGARRIASLELANGTKIAVSARGVVIDASYEGDVLRAAGASLVFGREPRAQYNESFGGITGTSAGKFPYPVDSRWANGTLLEFVQDGPDPRARVGQGDGNVMAYSYRVCLTTNASNQAPFTPPAGYNTGDFEIARRYVESELAHNATVSHPWGDLSYRSYPPGTKFDACCGMASVGIDAPGLARGYPNGTYAERLAIAARHRYYVQGLMWFWAHDPDSGVPASSRAAILKYGLCRDEFPNNGHFPPQLYVREASRLVGDRVFTQNDRIFSTTLCRNDSVALADWGFDIHEMQRVSVKANATKSGFEAWNEGLTSPGQGGNGVFDLPYSVLLPKRADAVNLLGPNCPSVSHVAFAGIREEPTLWALGQAAGAAAALVAQAAQATALQDLNVTLIQSELRRQGALYHFPSNTCRPAPPTPACKAYTVSGAGLDAVNGHYAATPQGGVYEKDSLHQLYAYEGVWRLAHAGASLYYTADMPTSHPPLSPAYWDVAAAGVAPTPALTCLNTTAVRAGPHRSRRAG